MVDFTIATYNPSVTRLAERCDAFAAYLKSLQREMLKQEGALTARAFIKFSPPIPLGGGMGDTGNARKQGRIAVERDIRSMVAPLNATLRGALDPAYGGMDAFNKWRNSPLRGGKASAVLQAIHSDPIAERAFNKAQNLYGNAKREPTQLTVMQDPGEIRNVHAKQRMAYRGRIKRHRGPDQNIKRAPYFAEPSALDRYIKTQQDQVGNLQSGWLKVITSIGTVKLRGSYLQPAQKGMPRHLYALSGTGEVRYDSNFFGRLTGVGAQSFINIRNPKGNINGVGDDATTKNNVILYRMSQIASRPYSRLLSDGVRRWNAGQKPTI